MDRARFFIVCTIFLFVLATVGYTEAARATAPLSVPANTYQSPFDLHDVREITYFNGTLRSDRLPVANTSMNLTLSLTPTVNLTDITMILSTPPGIDAPFSSGNGFSIGDLNKDQTYNVTFPVNLTKKTNFRNIHAILAAGNNGSVVQDEIFFEFPEDMSNFSAKDPISLEPSGNISAPDLVSPGSDGFNPAAEQFLIVYRFSFLARDNQIKPVRNAVVEVIDAGSGLPVLQSSTDQDGKCSISLDNSGGEIYLRIQASSPAARITDPDGSTWRWKTENITVNPGSGGYTGDGSIVEDPEPFQILDAVNRESDWIHDQTGWSRSRVVIVWPTEDWPHCHGDSIHLPLSPWDSYTIFHEYAHCIMFTLYHNSFPPSNPLTKHYIFSESDPGAAFIEGWAEFVPAAVTANPNYISQLGGNIETNQWYNVIDQGDMDGEVVEGSVASIFWDIFSSGGASDNLGLGFQDMFTILKTYHPGSMREFWDDWVQGSYPEGEKYTAELSQVFEEYGISVMPTPPVAKFTVSIKTGPAPLVISCTDTSTGAGIISRQWDFNNDGIVESTEKNPRYSYGTAGTYTVNLTVANAVGSTSKVKPNLIAVTGTPPPAPAADYNADPLWGNSPLLVRFNDTSSGNGITSWQWDFNDDGVTESTVRNPQFLYTNAGHYTVNLTVKNAGGTSSKEKPDLITVLSGQNETPEPDFAAVPLSGNAPLVVRFTDKSVGFGIDSWQWDFNNDGIIESTLQNPNYTYADPGTYSVNLTVANEAGSYWKLKPGYISVYSPAPLPIAKFSVTPKTGAAPLLAQFTDSSTGTGIGSWQWDLDNDGVVDSTLRNPAYSYANPGTYSVSLTVTNGSGSSTKSKPDLIRVMPPPDESLTADFTAVPLSGSAPLLVNFTDISRGSGISSWQWDFNNDGVIESTVRNAWYSYTSPGSYSVNLTIAGAGKTSSKLRQNYIVVSPPPAPPVAKFYISARTGTAPFTVRFTDSSSGSGIFAWKWDFNNDGITDSTSRNASYQYSTPGVYSVNLTVINSGGSDSKLKPDLIAVS